MQILVLLSLLPLLAAAQTTTTAALPPWSTGVVTEDGTCGGTTGWVCSPTWGACCSKDGVCGRSTAFCGDGCSRAGTRQSISGWVLWCGYCGDTTAHCGSGCQGGFGNCTAIDTTISNDGMCGAANGKICTGSTFGDCCSASGYCGTSSDHCDAGCQTAFGNCTAGSTAISTDGSCGANGKTCTGSTFGTCCSADGYCGTGSDHCDAGCQTSFGTCNAESTDISTDGSCGKNGKTCKGSTFGDCCSASGYCGKGGDYCDAGCQASFGTCSTGSTAISTDGSCSTNGKTCTGSSFGNCCSSSNYCGATAGHCGTGCQAGFGTCTTATTNNISTDGACNSNGKTCKGSAFGDCCSASGYCGNDTAHCGAGCVSAFGTCTSGASTISTDGICGTKNTVAVPELIAAKGVSWSKAHPLWKQHGNIS
ncbi:hypothetical protein G7054_g7955 [Neopestalotiopsis clavispora]|nr:hypothetical protein G7054_g7955 [Neopestalotiopsis clavispora]